jgi:hypothetical protein
LPRAKRDVQHADVQLLTIPELVDPKPLGAEELPALFLGSSERCDLMLESGELGVLGWAS